MNIQIFGKSKCFDTKKAERYFKERRIKVQNIDLIKYGMSGGEFDSVLRAVGGIDNLIDWNIKSPEIDLLKYMADPVAKEDKVFGQPASYQDAGCPERQTGDRWLLSRGLAGMGVNA